MLKPGLSLHHSRGFRYTYEDIKMSKTPINLNGRTILVTGSFYMAEEALRWMGKTSL